MTLNEFGAVWLEILQGLLKGISEIFRCIGDLMISGASPRTPSASINSLKLFSNNTVNMIVFFAVLGYILFINIYTFVLFRSDKTAAKRREQRTSERRLIGFCIAGGAIGGITAMNTAHHKTNKKSFSVTVTVLFVLQLALYCFVIGFLGFWTFL